VPVHTLLRGTAQALPAAIQFTKCARARAILRNNTNPAS